MANPRWAETSVPRSLPDRVAQLYYSNGLFCASHPIIIICVAVSIVLLCCYPLLSLPLPGNVPQSYTISSANSTAADMPRWLQTAEPACYIQQVVMKAAVSPWTDDMILTDAFRAPLAEAFRLLEVIQNYQGSNSHRKVKVGPLRYLNPEWSLRELNEQLLTQKSQSIIIEQLMGSVCQK